MTNDGINGGKGMNGGLQDIVVGVDGSSESFAALRWALNEAGKTGQQVNAVFGWTHSWDMGSEPDDDESWNKVRHEIARTLRGWVDEASRGIAFNPENLKLTSVKASGSAALLQIGADAQQIVVGRRNLGRVARWFLGSSSSSLAEEAKVPVTVVRGDEDKDSPVSVQDSIARSLSPESFDQRGGDGSGLRPVVVGIDGSKTSQRALDFAIYEASVDGRPLHVLFCWQMKDLGAIEGYETTVPSIAVGQEHAEKILASVVERVELPSNVTMTTSAFHIAAGKGLVSASRYANRVVVGSRGLSGLDAHFLGSVSRQVVDEAECTVTVVH
ncbi:universal stress protein [Bifidobacterium callimiconis]|uniref:UspA domain-containing protein n=1 Tax=Bifidobacterium callimiconis TaxID=2306973 RepID=A0A430FGC4_9BIFI|nr:universal stress protein [Bifidobacterium callimiconis]MBT1176620.1 universal stress protein [Bifidobacterium callimiconis]RSX51924.1 UspA domain-containing protein [Bifidobacterium callimiconis]